MDWNLYMENKGDDIVSRKIIEFNLKNVEDVFEQERPEYITIIKTLCLVNKLSKSLYDIILEAFHPGVGQKRHEAIEEIRRDLRRKIAYYENLKIYHERLKITLQLLDDYENKGYIDLDELDNFDLHEFQMDTNYTEEGIRGLNILNFMEKMEISDFCEEPTEIYEAEECEDYYNYQEYGFDYDEEESEFGRLEPYEGHEMYDYYHDAYLIEDMVVSLNDYLFKLIQKALFGGDLDQDNFECKYNYFNFGMYPKNVVDDEELDNVLSNLKPDNDGFVEHDGKKYYRLKAVLPKDREDWEYEDVRLSDGKEIQFGKIYHISVEPIKWRILEDNFDEMLLHTDEIIDLAVFDTTTNSYDRSSLRKYLNEAFFNKAFDPKEQESIQDNYLEDIESYDKISLLSTYEYDFIKYRMFSRDSRYLRITDYVTLKYMVPYVESFWTRTGMPDSDNDKAYDGAVVERVKDRVLSVWYGKFYFQDPKERKGLAPVIRVKKK